MSEKQFSELLTTLKDSSSNEGSILAIVTALGGVVLGALLTYCITERNNKNQFKRDILIYLNDSISDYLFYVKEYSILAKEKMINGLHEKEKEEAGNIAKKTQVLQNKIDIIIKNNTFSKTLEDVHTEMTNIVRDFNNTINTYQTYDDRARYTKNTDDLQAKINKYLEVISDLVNQNLK